MPRIVDDTRDGVLPAHDRAQEGDRAMKKYLLSIYQPDGETPPPEVLDPIIENLEALNEEMRAAGTWVFAGGLHPPSTATVVRSKDGRTCWSPTGRSSRARSTSAGSP